MSIDTDTHAPTRPKYQPMPEHSRESRDALTESIRRYGILVPVIRNEHGDTIEGHTREAIAAELGIGDIPFVMVPPGLSEADQRGLAYELNLARRHFDQAQKRELIAQSLKDDPAQSDREHARRCGSSHPTVASVRAELEKSGLVERFTTRVGADGVEQPATKPPVPQPITDPAPRPTPPPLPEPAPVPSTGGTADNRPWTNVEPTPDTKKQKPVAAPSVSAGPKKKRPAGDRPTRADLEEQIDVLLAENRSLREDLDEANEKVEELTKKLEEFQEQPLVAMAKAIGDGLDAPDTKVCTGCGQDKPASEFYRKTIGGHRQPCKVCTKAKEREKYASRNGADSEKAPA